MDSVLMWIVTPIFLAGLAQLIFGGRGDAPAEDDDDRGSGMYGTRDEAERNGRFYNSSSTDPYNDQGPGFYD